MWQSWLILIIVPFWLTIVGYKTWAVMLGSKDIVDELVYIGVGRNNVTVLISSGPNLNRGSLYTLSSSDGVWPRNPTIIDSPIQIHKIFDAFSSKEAFLL